MLKNIQQQKKKEKKTKQNKNKTNKQTNKRAKWNYDLNVIDRLFELRNCFHFLLAKVFLAHFTVISVNANIYLAKFQQKFTIR